MKVLIYIEWPVKAWCIPDVNVARLRERFPDVEFVHTRTMDDVSHLIEDVDASLTPHFKPEMVARAQRLRWVHSSAAAVEGLLPLAELAARGIVVTNSRGVQAIPIAEQVMGGLLVLARKFDKMLAAQREKRWIQNELAVDWPWMLDGRRMTIVGLGTIGEEIAKRANAFGMQVTGVRRHAERGKPAFVDRIFGSDQLNEALAGADVVVLSAPGVASTLRMIGDRQLALLNKGAILVNVARAQIVDDAAMRAALESGQLGGAVLDVFEREPLPESDALWSMPNVIITPHSAGFRSTHWDAATDVFTENLRRFQRGDPLLNVVDPSAGY